MTFSRIFRALTPLSPQIVAVYMQVVIDVRLLKKDISEILIKRNNSKLLVSEFGKKNSTIFIFFCEKLNNCSTQSAAA